MRAFVCVKPATFAGVKYFPGDSVPEEAIAPGRINAVISMGLIAEAPADVDGGEDQNSDPAVIAVPVKMSDGSFEDIEATEAQIAEAVTVLQLPVDDAVPRIAEIGDAVTLILINAWDSRKTVKNATAAKAKEEGN